MLQQNQTEVTDLPPMIVDRSPELARRGIPNSGPGGRYDHYVNPQKYIEGSTRGDGESCVLANILREMVPGCIPHIEGENPTVTLPDGTVAKVTLSQDLIEEIGKFDRGESNAFPWSIGVNIGHCHGF
jgi:hypothetical protein